ncbi:MAG: nucleotidyl transferase AbiEii/AbiGii toxin family protein [Planctomycetia bacterium]|nr:nucleotidyl transferase AbiEii/AbiGii toxin family protein [Planctomycetia bacterium]
MIPQAHITAWRAHAPWSDDAQVEQDLVLTRAVIELFADPCLASKLALRGGTCLHKLFFQPPCRYSEDIDLVQTEAVAIGPTLDAVRARLDPWLGKPKRDRGPGNVALTYRFQSEIPPVRPLRLKIEINTREHFAALGYERRRLGAQNPWFTGESEIVTFGVDELLGTKLRALFQRRKGRDLFDLWLGLEQGRIAPTRVVACFAEYMRREGHSVTRAQFEQNLYEKQANPTFLSDIRPLLRPGLSYDPAAAIANVRETLIVLLPGEAWRGPIGATKRAKPPRRRRGA